MTIDTLTRSEPSGRTPDDEASPPRWMYPHSVVPGDLGTHTGDPLQLMLESTGRTFDPTGKRSITTAAAQRVRRHPSFAAIGGH